MKAKACTIHIDTSEQTLPAVEGDTVMTALARNGIHLRSDCGGKGSCGKCRIQVLGRDEILHNAPKKDTVQEWQDRYACQTGVKGDMTLRIPGESIMPAEVVAKPFLDVGPPVHSSPKKEATSALQVAIDLGTSTVAVYLYDPTHNRITGSAVIGNPQMLYGRDVMSRISAIMQEPAHLDRMQGLIVKAVDRAIERLSADNDIHTDRIDAVQVVGNPTMIHIFWGETPESIGIHPFMPVSLDGKKASGRDLGLSTCPWAEIASLPVISGFLGADIVAAALACDLDHAAPGTMLIDVGTNGEILLKTESGLLGTSCATGPALEGAAISHGIHATSGAIDTVCIESNGHLELGVIQRRPDESRKIIGMCGSGVLSAVAALRKRGIIDASGGFSKTCTHPNLRTDCSGDQHFVLAEAEHTESGLPVSISQSDIRAVQMAKSALLTGIQLLCREAGMITPEHIFLAGAFGNFLNPDDAMTIGLMPPLEQGSYTSVGNAAGLGAVMLLKSPEYRLQAETIARGCHALDLACHPHFQDIFMENLRFPEVAEACVQ